MDKRKIGRRVAPIECYINTGSKLATLDAKSSLHVLPGQTAPGDPGPAAAPATYGQYLGSIVRYLCKNSHRALRNLLKRQAEKPAARSCPGQGLPTFGGGGKSDSPSAPPLHSLENARRPPALESASKIELISEKHGAFYSVSRLRLHFADEMRSFAVNCAVSPWQQAFLRVESKLVAKLHSKFALPHIPTPFLRAKTPMEGDRAGADLMLSISEWFEGYHEFHLSSNASGAPKIRVWDPPRPGFPDEATASLFYEEASSILTSYLDTGSFAQIYPWHHAAGDFVVDPLQNPPNLKLITVRGYRSLLAAKSRNDKMLGTLHFFVNLGIRMRIDRLDGTGDLAWAGSQALPGVIRGFARAWEARQNGKEDLPNACEIFSLFLNLAPEERVAFAEAVAQDGRVEADEADFLQARLPRHVIELSNALTNVL